MILRKDDNMKQFNEIIKESRPTVVDFYATWCGPCQHQMPIIDKVKDSCGDRANVIKIDVGWGMKLGLAGGPLVVAILLSQFGYKFHLITYTSSSSSLLMRELGICLFLASVGISSGQGFAETVFNSTGMWWVIWGVMITVIPLLIVGAIARGVYKINFLTIMGLMSGGYTDPPALAYANNSTGNDAPAVAYSTVYPLTMFLRVVAAQALVLCFM